MHSNFQPYSYYQRFLEGVDGTMINTSNLLYTRRVEIKKKKEIIKQKEDLERRGSRN